MASYEQFSGLPMVGTIQTDGGSRVLHISETYETDSRDDDTFYVATSSDTSMPVVFLFVADLERGGVLLQAVDNRAEGGAGKTDGKYLAVHKATPDDELYPDFIRVIVHGDREKAAVWTFADVDGQTLLQVKENPDETGEDSVGSYLAVPPDSDRDESSAYVAVTADSGAATPVKAVAEGSSGGAGGGYGGSSYAAPVDEGNDYEAPAEEEEETGYGETSYEQPEGEEGGYGGGYENPEGEDTGYGETSYENPEGGEGGYGEMSYETPEGEGTGYGEGGYEAPTYE